MMPKQLPRLLIAVGLACSIGLHWSFLQSVAWTTMLVSSLSTTSFSRAVQRTFDGKHPCALCKVIAAGKNAEKKTDTLVLLKKFEAVSQAAAIVILPPASLPRVTSADAVPASRAQSPPTPPPRPA
jgi:hypothetical protein